MPTLKDVAQLAGVDASTVSRVLNNSKDLTVRPETRKRIVEASRALGYRPNTAARSLRTRVTNTLGLLVSDIQNPVYSQILQGVQQAAWQRDYCVLVMQSTFAGLPDSHRQHYRDLISTGRVDGFIIAEAQPKDELINELAQQGLPFVLVTRLHPSVTHYVVGDDAGGARLAVEHLLSLGHRRIAHLAGPLYTETALGRLQGFRQALQSSEALFDTRYVVEAGFDADSGRHGMEKLLTLHPRPTAVFATNTLVAIGAIRAIHEAGLSVPDDISVAALQDIPIATEYIPSITAVRMPLQEMGARAAEMLIAQLDGKQEGRGEVLRDPMELIARESTCPPSFG